jgi:hypothetical protein
MRAGAITLLHPWQLQVFDYPSIDAITQYITSIAPAALPDLEEEYASEEEEITAAALRPSRALAPVARAAPAAGAEAAAVLVGVMSLAHRTSCDAVLSLEGKDASRRVPFGRWEVDRQLQVRQSQRIMRHLLLPNHVTHLVVLCVL